MPRRSLALVPFALLLACGSTQKDPTFSSSGGTGGTAGAQSGGGSGGSTPGGGGGVGGAAGAGTGGAAGAPTRLGDVIDDFESGARYWAPFTDVGNGGGSRITTPPSATTGLTMQGVGRSSPTAMEIVVTFDQGSLTYPPFVGVSAEVKELVWTRYQGVSYYYKGPAHSIRLETSDVLDYDFHGVKFPAATEWTLAEVRLADVRQEGWGKLVPFEASRIQNLSFHLQGSTGATRTLTIDDILAVPDVSDPCAVPDLQIHAPAPPAKQTVTGQVTNPLQAKAMRYLDRGMNISDWLEARRFTAFDYDETWVKNLAKAGFKGIRLPIDLGRYVVTEEPLTFHADLWTILDSFETWTRTQGLSLTIDWHEYDGSFRALETDPRYQAHMARVWGAVAQHFAANPREDLFFELINEPALSAGSNIDSTERGPTQERLTEFAEAMLVAIRAHDTTHTVLFGDYNWSGIDDLASRSVLLSDRNVVYVFHNYDPFLFTHQGTSWTELGGLGDIPWPYSEERWSTCSHDLGYRPSAGSWPFSLLQTYYQSGNKNYLYNRMAKAKEWSVKHNVPIVCNEFGPYTGRARHEDIIRYYTDLMDVFEELEVPWQVWWQVMDKSTGVVPTDLRAAMHLDQ